jgi:hypothetical protein
MVFIIYLRRFKAKLKGLNVISLVVNLFSHFSYFTLRWDETAFEEKDKMGKEL